MLQELRYEYGVTHVCSVPIDIEKEILVASHFFGGAGLHDGYNLEGVNCQCLEIHKTERMDARAN